jgi:putative transcriptional regulator
MPIEVRLNVLMAERKISLTELALEVDITMANLSILKNGKARAVRFSTLEKLCRALDCQPGEILRFRENQDDSNTS